MHGWFTLSGYICASQSADPEQSLIEALSPAVASRPVTDLAQLRLEIYTPLLDQTNQ